MAQYVKKVAKSHEEWLDLRKGGIGSSDAGTIMGVNKWETPYALWCRLKGLTPPKEETFAMTRGHLLEDAVAQFFMLESGKKVIASSAKEWVAICVGNPILRVSPDRLYYIKGKGGAKGVLECKTTEMNIDKDNIPQSWFCQLQYQMGILGLKEGTLAWLIGSRKFDYQTFEFNETFFNTLCERIMEFWNKYIEGDERPPLEVLSDYQTAFPISDPSKEVLTNEETNYTLEQLIHIKERIKELEEKKETLELKIKAHIKDAERLVDISGTVLATWKSSAAKRSFDSKSFAKEHPQQYEAYVIEKPGTRTLLIK